MLQCSKWLTRYGVTIWTFIPCLMALTVFCKHYTMGFPGCYGSQKHHECKVGERSGRWWRVTLHVQTWSGRDRIIPLMRRPHTDSAPNMPVTLPRNQLLIRYVVMSPVHTVMILCYGTRHRYKCLPTFMGHDNASLCKSYQLYELTCCLHLQGFKVHDTLTQHHIPKTPQNPWSNDRENPKTNNKTFTHWHLWVKPNFILENAYISSTVFGIKSPKVHHQWCRTSSQREKSFIILLWEQCHLYQNLSTTSNNISWDVPQQFSIISHTFEAIHSAPEKHQHKNSGRGRWGLFRRHSSKVTSWDNLVFLSLNVPTFWMVRKCFPFSFKSGKRIKSSRAKYGQVGTSLTPFCKHDLFR
jgi:hypothetical protein